MKGVVLQWYLAGKNVWSIGALGMIDKDFHDRKDLLRVYVEETEWGHGMAGISFDAICIGMKERVV